MMRGLARLTLLLLVAQATGAGALLEMDGCADCCPDEGHCLPSCESCMCFPGVRPVLASQGADVVGPQTHADLVADPARLFFAPEPREILHVPRLLA